MGIIAYKVKRQEEDTTWYYLQFYTVKKEARRVNDLQMGYMNEGGGLSKNIQLKNIVF